MKKLFFAFVAASVFVLASCNNKPAEGGDATPADSTAVSSSAASVSPEAAAPADSSATATTDTAAAAK